MLRTSQLCYSQNPGEFMPILRQSEAPPVEEELTQAVRRVYERYGQDLDAFFRDVQELAKMNEAKKATASEETEPPIGEDATPKA
jgi:hypothetical protein